MRFGVARPPRERHSRVGDEWQDTETYEHRFRVRSCVLDDRNCRTVTRPFQPRPSHGAWCLARGSNFGSHLAEPASCHRLASIGAASTMAEHGSRLAPERTGRPPRALLHRHPRLRSGSHGRRPRSGPSCHRGLHGVLPGRDPCRSAPQLVRSTMCQETPFSELTRAWVPAQRSWLEPHRGPHPLRWARFLGGRGRGESGHRCATAGATRR